MKQENNICIGVGLLALDVVMGGNYHHSPGFYAGGSCGNVLTVLSYLGWDTSPVARLAENKATELLFADLHRWNVDTSLISIEESGSTPIIVERLIIINEEIKHRFEFRDPETGGWLPRFKAIVNKSLESLKPKIPQASVFYFDRISRASIELARFHKEQGALVVLEPSSIDNSKHFEECLSIIDILKYSDERIKNYKALFPKRQVPLEIETQGKWGLAFRYLSDDWEPMSAPNIDKVVDSVGAGDWCTAGIISRLGVDGNQNLLNSSKEDIISALRYGQILGALNCQFESARGMMYSISFTKFSELTQKLEKDYLISSNSFKYDTVVEPNPIDDFESLLTLV